MHVARARARDRLVAGARPRTRPGSRRRARAARARAKRSGAARVGLDQQRDALDRGEAPDVEQHRALVAGQRGHVLGPLGAAVDLDGWKSSGSKPLLTSTHCSCGTPEQPLGARVLALREHDQPLAARRPAAHPLGPRLARASSAPGSSSIASSISSSVPCRCPTTGTSGATRARGLVERRQVVQVQHVGVAAPADRQRAAPRPRPGARRRRRPARRTRGPGAPSRSSKEGWNGGSASSGSGASSAAVKSTGWMSRSR